MDYASLLESVSCNLCGADDYRVVYPPRYESSTAKDLADRFRSSGEEVLIDQLVQCKRCGLKYLNPRLPPEKILEGYSAGSDENFISQASAREMTFERCLEALEKVRPGRGRILDVGTAGGSFLRAATKRGWEVAGCEPNRWLCDWARDHYGFSIHLGTLSDLPNSWKGSFDVVTFWDVLEHVSDPKATLRECLLFLKPGGILAVNYPDIGSWISRVMGRRWVFLLSVHLTYFTTDTLTQMLQAVGFTPLSWKPHFQQLELQYLFQRLHAYAPPLSRAGLGCVRFFRFGKVRIPYWLGQTLVLAKRS